MKRIRVAFLSPHFRPGGAERVVLNWLGALDRDRFEPLLLLGRVEGAFLTRLPADVTPHPIGGHRALGRPLHIARALKAHRVDIAYSATSAMNLALLAAPTRVPRIVSEHTPPEAYGREAKWPLLRRAATRLLQTRAAFVAAPTTAIAAATGHPRAVVLPNPVVHEVPPIGTATNGSHIVTAGRLVAAKGLDTLIDACAMLDIPYTLTIHGEGPLRDALAARIAAHGLGDRVTLAGHADPLAPALAAADLFVLASRREGFGNVLIEAMAVGTPVLATRAGGPETFIENGVNGFLAPPDDPAALAATIAGLLADPARRASVREAGCTTAQAYGIAASIRAFEALLDRVSTR